MPKRIQAKLDTFFAAAAKKTILSTDDAVDLSHSSTDNKMEEEFDPTFTAESQGRTYFMSLRLALAIAILRNEPEHSNMTTAEWCTSYLRTMVFRNRFPLANSTAATNNNQQSVSVGGTVPSLGVENEATLDSKITNSSNNEMPSMSSEDVDVQPAAARMLPVKCSAESEKFWLNKFEEHRHKLAPYLSEPEVTSSNRQSIALVLPPRVLRAYDLLKEYCQSVSTEELCFNSAMQLLSDLLVIELRLTIKVKPRLQVEEFLKWFFRIGFCAHSVDSEHLERCLKVFRRCLYEIRTQEEVACRVMTTVDSERENLPPDVLNKVSRVIRNVPGPPILPEPVPKKIKLTIM